MFTVLQYLQDVACQKLFEFVEVLYKILSVAFLEHGVFNVFSYCQPSSGIPFSKQWQWQ